MLLLTQAAAPNESTIKTALKSTAETAVSNGSVAVTINQISYIAPIAGTSANPSGTNGSYTFTITVSKGSQSETTAQKTIIITATPYTGGMAADPAVVPIHLLRPLSPPSRSQAIRRTRPQWTVRATPTSA